LGLKKKRVSSLILVFEDMSPENRLSNGDTFMSSFFTHNMTTKYGQDFFNLNAKTVPMIVFYLL